MMLHHCDIDKEQFLQMDPEELRALIDEKITGESLQVFALTTYIPDGKTEIELKFKMVTFEFLKQCERVISNENRITHSQIFILKIKALHLRQLQFFQSLDIY